MTGLGGIANTNGAALTSMAYIPFGFTEAVSSIAGGHGFNCFVRSSGSLYCLGSNSSYGQLGQNQTVNKQLGSGGTGLANSVTELPPLVFHTDVTIIPGGLTSLVISGVYIVPVSISVTLYNIAVVDISEAIITTIATSPCNSGPVITVNGGPVTAAVPLRHANVNLMKIDITADGITRSYSVYIRQLLSTNIAAGKLFACLLSKNTVTCWGVRGGN